MSARVVLVVLSVVACLAAFTSAQSSSSNQTDSSGYFQYVWQMVDRIPEPYNQKVKEYMLQAYDWMNDMWNQWGQTDKPQLRRLPIDRF